jgi:tetratricopeptide (TPR) repeat protein
MALARLKSSEAIAAFRRAIELDPSEPLFRLYASEAYAVAKDYAAQKTELQEYLKLKPEDPDRLAEAQAAVEVLEALGGKDLAIAHAPESPKPIPFQTTLNLIFAQIMLEDKGPYNFAIDTGATQVVISEKVAGELGLKPITKTVMHGVGGGGRVESKLYKLNDLTTGDVKVKNLPVGTFNDPLVKRPANPGESISAWYFSNLLLIPIEVNGVFQGNFVVDTGAVTTVLSHTMAAKLGVTEDTPGAKVEMGVAGVGGVEGVVLSVPAVTLKTAQNSEEFRRLVAIDLKNISRMIGTEVSGVLGYDFLSSFKLTLDYNTAEIFLAGRQ